METSEQHVNALLRQAGDTRAQLLSRVSALKELAQLHRSDLAPRIRNLWGRPRPAPDIAPENWDPQGAERVVDLYIILALDKSEDPSLLDQIAHLVAHAGRTLQGPEDELVNAAKVIAAVGSLEPVAQLIELAGARQKPSASNAVRTLQLLRLPSPPTGGPIPDWPELSKPLSFSIRTLKQELEAISQLSSGRVELSDGTKHWIAEHDYDRGNVRRTDTTLSRVLEQEIDILDFTYAVGPNRLVICTFDEAGRFWSARWPVYSQTLNYDPSAGRWIARADAR